MSCRHLREELIVVLSKFSLGDVLGFEERFDEQYHALRFLYSRLARKELLMDLALLNALVSYQLNSTGEEYWWEFAKGVDAGAGDPILAVTRFLASSRCNARLRGVKLRKLKRAAPIIHALEGRRLYYAENPVSLWRLIHTIAGTRPNAKTVVFAVKMYNYAARIHFSRRFVLPSEIPIPVDSRIRRISVALCAGDPVAFWAEVSRETGIPPLHLDSLLWVSYRIARSGEVPRDPRVRELISFINNLLGGLSRF